MRWALRVCAWSLVLVLPCVALAGPYQRLLLGMLGIVLGVPGMAQPVAPPDLSAANMLGVYAAMCLATTSVNVRVRICTLVLGCAGMILLELGVGLVSIGAELHQAQHGSWPEAGRRVFAAVVSVQRFGGAPLLWLVLLGRRALSPDVWGKGAPARDGSSSTWSMTTGPAALKSRPRAADDQLE